MSDDEIDIDTLLSAVGFDPDECVLTRRQAEILALRERGVSQREIANRLGTSRANVSSIESSARRNVVRARNTVSIADALEAPVRVHVGPGSDLFEVPDRVYDACDEVDTKVTHSSAAMLRKIRERVPTAIDEHRVVEPFVVGVGDDGAITVQRSER